MSIGRHKRKFFYATVLVIMAFLAVGAHRVVRTRQNRARCNQRIREQWLEWHQMVAAELPHGHQRGWSQVAEEAPDALLRGCVIEHTTDEEQAY